VVGDDYEEYGVCMKKVIFIGGTAYSGSTFFDMTLANDPKGFSLGEVFALFYPYRKKHLDIETLDNDVDWQAIKKSGTKNLYLNIFDKFPEVEFIVDSSKSQLWIHDRTIELKAAGIDVKNILIWKEPAEFQKSMKKRNEDYKWVKSWVNYHKYYVEMVKDWRSVRYSDFAQKKETLRKLCEVLEIDYFEGKEKFWEKKQFTLYGNTSAKIHLFDEKTNDYDKHQHYLEERVPSTIIEEGQHVGQKHRKIYYDKTDGENNGRYLTDPRFKSYLDILQYLDINNQDIDFDNLKGMKKNISVDFLYKMGQIAKLKVFGHFTNKL